MARIDLEDQLADGDRLDEKAALRVAIGRASECVHRVVIAVQPAVRLGGTLGPLRVVRLEGLELEVRGERALVFSGRSRLRRFHAQRTCIASHPTLAL